MIKKLYAKYEEIIKYVFFGGLTTLINYLSYVFFADFLHIGTLFSTTAAWALSVIFAFITNKIWVFKSRNTSFDKTIREAAAFFAARILSGVLDVGIMLLFVDFLGFNDKIIKILSNVIIIILNYLASKIFIFRK